MVRLLLALVFGLASVLHGSLVAVAVPVAAATTACHGSGHAAPSGAAHHAEQPQSAPVPCQPAPPCAALCCLAVASPAVIDTVPQRPATPPQAPPPPMMAAFEPAPPVPPPR